MTCPRCQSAEPQRATPVGPECVSCGLTWLPKPSPAEPPPLAAQVDAAVERESERQLVAASDRHFKTALANHEEAESLRAQLAAATAERERLTAELESLQSRHDMRGKMLDRWRKVVNTGLLKVEWRDGNVTIDDGALCLDLESWFDAQPTYEEKTRAQSAGDALREAAERDLAAARETIRQLSDDCLSMTDVSRDAREDRLERDLAAAREERDTLAVKLERKRVRAKAKRGKR